MQRTILHCDCNGFFASVECALNPALKNVPMIVCGSSENRHGIVLAKNELAKKFNIKTAETVWSAQKKCPDLVLAPPHMDIYRDFSRRINEIYSSYTDMVEPFGIDESWLDVTASRKLFGCGKKIGDELREKIKKQLDVTISVGVSFNKVFAKLGSDYKKPDATTVITAENYKTLLYPLPVGDMLYAGKSTVARLKAFGINTIGDLAACDVSVLESLLGKTGVILHDYANGLDESPVKKYGENDPVKSVGNGITFKRDLNGLNDIKAALSYLADSVGARMRKNGVKCTCVQLAVKDPQLKTINRQKTLSNPTYLSRDLFECAMEIIKSSWNLNKPIRMLTLTAANLVLAQNAAYQLNLLEEGKTKQAEKADSLECSIDAIREKYGKNSIKPASSVNSDLGID